MAHPASRRAAIVLAALILILGLPVGIVLAGHQFGDVPDGHLFHADIDAIADAGVTAGCGGGNYCPEDYVTRGEMAAFMNRLGALAPGKTPVVNADELDGLDSAAFQHAADKFIPVNLFGAFLEGGAAFASGFGPNCCLELPEGPLPSFRYGFTLPPDYTPGTALTLEVSWHINQTGCSIDLRPSFLSVGRPGGAHILGDAATSGLKSVGSDTRAAPATANNVALAQFTIDSPDAADALQPGDAIGLGIYRASTYSADTCTADMMLNAAQILYE